MPKYIAFLRAINVGGHTVKMDELRRSFESLGLDRVETFIASGNVIFESVSKNARSLETKISVQLHKSLGYEVAVFIRTGAELAGIAAYAAFPQAAIDSAAAYNVALIAEPPDSQSKQKLMALINDIDNFAVHDREVYWLCLKKQSESAFSNAVLERTLGIKSTLRGINTVRKMAEKYAR